MVLQPGTTRLCRDGEDGPPLVYRSRDGGTAPLPFHPWSKHPCLLSASSRASTDACSTEPLRGGSAWRVAGAAPTATAGRPLAPRSVGPPPRAPSAARPAPPSPRRPRNRPPPPTSPPSPWTGPAHSPKTRPSRGGLGGRQPAPTPTTASRPAARPPTPGPSRAPPRAPAR